MKSAFGGKVLKYPRVPRPPILEYKEAELIYPRVPRPVREDGVTERVET